MKPQLVTIDSNVFLRSAGRSSSDFEAAKTFFISLSESRVRVLLSPKVIHECWVVLTRPRDANGFGLDTDEAHRFAKELTHLYRIRSETKRCLTTWLGLVKEHEVTGVKAHDARLVAWMIVNGMERMITFNTSDFKGFPITATHPAHAGL